MSQEEVIQSLVISDIYLTPYLGKDQAVSGTLAYGVGYGRALFPLPIVTPIIADTIDALLICPKDKAQAVKEMVDLLKEKGMLEYI